MKKLFMSNVYCRVVTCVGVPLLIPSDDGRAVLTLALGPLQVPGSAAGLQVHGHRVPGHAGLEDAEDQRVQSGEDGGGTFVTRKAPPPQPAS